MTHDIKPTILTAWFILTQTKLNHTFVKIKLLNIFSEITSYHEAYVSLKDKMSLHTRPQSRSVLVVLEQQILWYPGFWGGFVVGT